MAEVDDDDTMLRLLGFRHDIAPRLSGTGIVWQERLIITGPGVSPGEAGTRLALAMSRAQAGGR